MYCAVAQLIEVFKCRVGFQGYPGCFCVVCFAFALLTQWAHAFSIYVYKSYVGQNFPKVGTDSYIIQLQGNLSAFEVSNKSIMMYSLVSLLLLLACSIASGYRHMIVVASNGHDNPECLKWTERPCQTLGYAVRNFPDKTSVLIEVAKPGIILSTAVSFVGYTDISIVGEEISGTVSIVCNSSDAGLSFANVTGLSLSNINLTGCGVARNVTRFEKSVTFIEISALHLFNCSDVNVTSFAVFKSRGTAISILDSYGKLNITNTCVMKSSIKDYSDKMYGGNGLAIEFTPLNGNNFNSSNCNYKHCSTMYTINNCTFLRNKADAGSAITANFSHSWRNIGCMGSGGGLCISLGPCSTNISVSIESCTINNNTAVLYGGGSKIQTLDTSRGNQVSLIRTNFSNNVALGQKMGGGLELVFSYYAQDVKTYKRLVGNTTMNFNSCCFINNTASSGGGVNIFSGEVAMEDDESAITFSNSTWTSNSAALYGAAVHVQPGVWASRNPGHYPYITFRNCNFSQNKITPNKTSCGVYEIQENGAGAFLSNFIQVSFCGETTFESNNSTALYLSASVASFCAASRVMFNSNSGINGGAILLVGRSFLYLDEASNFTFVENHARDFGGAIYSQSTESKVHQPCFIYRGLNVSKSNFYFINNTAGLVQGNHIFASSFLSCNIFCSPHSKPFECIGNFIFYPNKSSTATMPTKFSVNTTQVVKLFPGLPLKLPLLVSDSEGNNVSNVSYQATLVQENSSISVDPAFRYVSANTISLVGKKGERAKLRLDDLSDGVSILLEIALDDCPPGYILNADNKCECVVSQYYGLWNCKPVYLMYGVWMGHCTDSNQSDLCTSDCPLGYCNYDTNGHSTQLPFNASLLKGTICSSTRTGKTCGECRPGHSVYYNSPSFECGTNRHCYLSPLYFTLSTILPLAILLVMLMLFDTVAGTASCSIPKLYACST